ncbi:MYG1 family protein, partial [Akkermansiaceae bacterium]|nr:MYG1 family protein [Akkermansiaceae bacterium]
EHEVAISRREPSEQDLSDASIVVVDVGLEWDEAKMNFDHHQFPRDAEPLCALSLVLKHLGIYEETRKFCNWLEVAEYIDTRGPNDTAEWLGVEREAMSKLNSPLDITLLRRFAASNDHQPGQPIYEVMKMVGEDLLSFVRGMKDRLGFIAQHSEIWEMTSGKKALFLPRTNPLPDETSMGMGRYVEDIGMEEEIVALVYPDRRGEGYGLSRFNDDKRMEFTRIGDEVDVHFAHNKGFIAKTSSADTDRLKVLLNQSWIGA